MAKKSNKELLKAFNVKSQILSTTKDYNAFKDKGVTNITLSNNIKKIGISAFEGNDIETIFFAEGLEQIGEKSFYDTGLLRVSIPSSVTTIGANAFGGNNELSTIIVTGKSSSKDFTSLGSNWNGTCNNIEYYE